jgi:hypothetical protein
MNISGGIIIIENAAIKGDASISIFDTLGKEYLKKNIAISSSKEIIPLDTTLPTGIYVLSLSQEDKKYASKVVVK